MLGKIKTCMQIAYVLCALLEPVVFGVWFDVPNYNILTYATMFLMSLFTVLSGANYIKGAWKYLDSNK